ncbi:MAG: BatA domain-containing protein [Pseudomonadota bacterium]
MAFAAPLALLALAALAIPLWLHRREVPSADRRLFGSTRFLEPSPRRTRVERKIQYWLLLALRCLLLAVVAFAFARPFLESAPTAALRADGLHVLVIDTSLSMQRGNAMVEAQRAARRAVAAIPGGDAVFVARSDARGIRIDTESLTRTALDRFIDGVTAGSHRTDFADVAAAAGRFAAAVNASRGGPTDAANPPVTLHLVSDLQQSAVPPRFADMVPAERLTLALYPVSASDPNGRIVGLRDTGDTLFVDVASDQGAVVSGRALELTVNGTTVDNQTVAANRAVFRADSLADGENTVAAQFAAADPLAGDDRWFAVVDRSPPTDVFLISARDDSAAALYLGAAYAAGADFRLVATTPSNFDRRELGRTSWLVVDDPAALPADLLAAVGDFVEKGGQALVLGGEATLSAGNWSLPARNVGTARSTSGDFIAVTGVASEHPTLGEAAPWTAVRVARYVPTDLTSDDNVLVELDTGDPLLFETTLGEGRLLVLTTPLAIDWTDFAQRGAFVGFALDTARTLAGSGRIARSYTVGERLPLDFTESASGEVVAPDGNRRVTSGTIDASGRVLLDIPGFYEVYTEADQFTVAVNPDPRESDPTVMSEALQQRWIEALPRRPQAAPTATRSDVPDATTLPLWPWLLAALAGLLIVEQLLANWFIGRQPNGRQHA